MESLLSIFITLLRGTKYIVTADNLGSAQCFDIAQGWSRLLGGHPFKSPTAAGIYNETQNGFYEQIANSPTNMPILGDIVVFNWPHVVIATGKNTTEMQFEGVSQNSPIGTDTEVRIFPYKGVIGWLRKAN